MEQKLMLIRLNCHQECRRPRPRCAGRLSLFLSLCTLCVIEWSLSPFIIVVGNRNRKWDSKEVGRGMFGNRSGLKWRWSDDTGLHFFLVLFAARQPVPSWDKQPLCVYFLRTQLWRIRKWLKPAFLWSGQTTSRRGEVLPKCHVYCYTYNWLTRNRGHVCVAIH